MSCSALNGRLDCGIGVVTVVNTTSVGVLGLGIRVRSSPSLPTRKFVPSIVGATPMELLMILWGVVPPGQ